MTRTRPLLAAATLLTASLLLAAATATEARASHYRLGESELVTPEEQSALEKHGVDSTLALYDAAATKKARRALSRKTGLTWKRLTELAEQCDLIRIKGVGTTMVRLLQAAGVKHSDALRKLAPADLAAKMKAANAREKISEILPGEQTLESWIRQAQRLPRKLER